MLKHLAKVGGANVDYPYLWPILVHVRPTKPIGEEIEKEDCRRCQTDENSSGIDGDSTGGEEEKGMRVASEESDEQVSFAMIGRRERVYSLSRALARCWDLGDTRPEATGRYSSFVIHKMAGEKWAR